MKSWIHASIVVLTFFMATGAFAQTPDSIAIVGDVVSPGAWSAQTVKNQFAGEIKTINYTTGPEKKEKSATGIPLLSIIDAAQLRVEKTPKHYDLSFIVTVTARDGYRAFFSYAELAHARRNPQVWLVWEEDGKPLGEKEAPLRLIIADDPDRSVFGLASVTLTDGHKMIRGMTKNFTIIGMGPGDADLMTGEAQAYLAMADVVVSPQDISNSHAPWLVGKPVLFDPMFDRGHVHSNPEMKEQPPAKSSADQRQEGVQKIREALAQGKNVAFLDWGDPLVFGSSSWIRRYFTEDEYHIVPSISAFNVANAVIAREVTCNGSVVMTSPHGLRNNEELLAAAAKKGDTISVFMGLREFHEMMPLLKKHYDGGTPVTIVYNAGIHGTEHQVKGNIGNILDLTSSEQEKHLGMIYIGPCLADRGI